MVQRLNPMAFSEAERTDYLMAVASLAAADGIIDSREVLAVRELSLLFELGPFSRARILAACEMPPEDLPQILERLSESPLRYSLVTDLAVYSYSDGHLDPSEEAHTRHFGKLLRVDSEHIEAILTFAGRLNDALQANQGVLPSEALEDGRAALAEAGVPVEAVAGSGTLLGLERRGVALGEGWGQ